MRHVASTSNIPHYNAAMREPLNYPSNEHVANHFAQQNDMLVFQGNDRRNAPFAPRPKYEGGNVDGNMFQYQEAKMNLPAHHSAVPPQPQTQSQHQTRDKGTELYKTELCRKWVTTGTCRYGSKCQFAHGVAELRKLVRHPLYKTSLCKSYQASGMCRYGSRCRFIHDETEQELSGLTRSNSSNNVAYAASSRLMPRTMGSGRMHTPAFPRVPSAPENLNNQVQQMHDPVVTRRSIAGSVIEHSPPGISGGWSHMPNAQGAAIPKNYSHGQFSYDQHSRERSGFPPSPQLRSSIPSSLSTQDFSYARRTHHSFSEDQSSFQHPFDPREIPISSSTDSSNSSAASSGDHVSPFASTFAIDRQVFGEAEPDLNLAATDAAQKLLKSRSQPALATLSTGISKHFSTEDALGDVTQHFDSFHIADLSETSSNGHKGSIAEPLVEQPTSDEKRLSVGTSESGESRLDFFRSISNVDLASLDKEGSKGQS